MKNLQCHPIPCNTTQCLLCGACLGLETPSLWLQCFPKFQEQSGQRVEFFPVEVIIMLAMVMVMMMMMMTVMMMVMMMMKIMWWRLSCDGDDDDLWFTNDDHTNNDDKFRFNLFQHKISVAVQPASGRGPCWSYHPSGKIIKKITPR